MDKERILKIVNKSPEAVKINAKDQWIALFHPFATVEDPVGAPAHHGHPGLSVFYDCFIAENDVTFVTSRDFIDEKACRLVRITDIHISLQRSGSGLVQPAHLIYDVDPKTALVTKLQANWQMNHAKPMGTSPKQILTSLWFMTLALVPIFKKFGMGFALRYFVGFLVGPFSRGKQLARTLLDVASKGDELEFSKLFDDAEAECIQIGCAKIKPSAVINTVWGSTSSFEIVGPMRSGGMKTTVQYRRHTKSGIHKTGFAEINLRWKPVFSPVVQDMYIFEEES